jgi:hypothetical protein
MSAFIKPGKVVECVRCSRPFVVSRKHFKLCSDECARKRRIDTAIAYYHAHKRASKVVKPVDPVQEAKLRILERRFAKRQPLFPITTKQLRRELKKVR